MAAGPNQRRAQMAARNSARRSRRRRQRGGVDTSSRLVSRRSLARTTGFLSFLLRSFAGRSRPFLSLIPIPIPIPILILVLIPVLIMLWF